MKNLTTTSLFIFGVVCAAVLTAGLVFYQNNKINNPSVLNNLGLENSSGSSVSGAGALPEIILNAAEISKHNSAGNCWLIINNKIYNVTSYLSAHPGGAGTITPYCGKEASQAFATKGGKGSHSSFAAGLLANYYIGDLNQTASPEQIQQKVNSANSAQPSARGGGKEDDDDEFDD